MNTWEATYDAGEQAWRTGEKDIERDVYIIIRLSSPGKVVIRQTIKKGNIRPRIPIGWHKDTSEFHFRLTVIPKSVKIEIFTSTNPKSIIYAYI